MRNLKKFLALVLAMLMIVSASATVSAFADVDEDNQYADAIADLVEKGIVNGVGGDKFDPDASVLRYQMALMMARALNPSETDWSTGMTVFTDVTEWSGAIAYAYMNNIVTGTSAGKFTPNEGIKYQDALIMAVRALGYTVDVKGDPYWLAAYKQAVTLGLTKNVAVTNGEKALTRAETAQVIYNMLYATPANGGATIAATNFGEATAANTTTFVITATAKQAYNADAKSVDSDYVGVQALVDGIPSGDIMYIPAAMLGFDADEADDYFGYAFDFVNYNAKTGSFDKVIKGLDPTVVYSTDITNGTTKITYDGVAYYPVDEITGDAIKNEIVIFNGTETSTVKTLLLNKDGDILDATGNVVATYVQSAGGTKMYLYNGTIITEAKATDTLGVPLSTVTRFDTLTASTLDSTTNKTYQLNMFDDDRDGKFERAVASQVYMSVYVAKGSDGKEDALGPMFDVKDVTYTEALAKGNVFVYTYNDQLKVVNVIDVLDVQYGTIDKLDLTNYKAQSDASKTWLAKVTIDGKAFVVGNTDRTNVMGATLKETGTAPTSFADIANNARISYTNIDKFYKVGSPIKFYSYNDVIIYAETYAIEDSFSYMVVNSLSTWDSGNFTVDAYVNGVKGEYTVSKMYDAITDSVINLNDVMSLKYTSLLTAFYNNCYGKVYKTVKLADGTYQISAAFDKVVDGNNYNSSFKLYKAVTGKYEFNDGITDMLADKSDRIRTNASTKFYFINTTDNTVSLFTGAIVDGYVINSGATVFVDKLGYGTDTAKNGVATTVVVYYSDATQIEGFNLSSVTNAYVYIPTPGQFTVDSAANLGLTNKSGTYYEYGTVAVNLSTGDNLKVYSKYGTGEVGALKAGCFYKVDGLGIVTEEVAEGAAIKKTTLNNTVADIDINNQYFFIDGVAAVSNKVTKLITVKSTDLSAKKTNSIEYLAATAKNVWYLDNDLADGTVVLIIGGDVTTTPTTITSNATYTYNGTGLTATVTTPSAAIIENFKLTVYVGNSTTIDTTLAANIAAGEATSVVLRKGGDSSFALAANEKAYVTKNADGTINITVGIKDFSGLYAKTLTAGTYQLEITFANENPADAAVRNLIYVFSVQ